MNLEELKFAPFYDLDKKYALLTAGIEDNFNTMTISWGSFGTLWNLPVVTVYVKPIRYTYQFMEDNDYFTISFYDESYKMDLLTLGTRSGRDGNKISSTRLHPLSIDNGMTFKEANVTLVCKKLYFNDIDLSKVKNNIPDELFHRFYATDPAHRMYIGEVVDIIKK